MKLYRSHQGIFAEHAGDFYAIDSSSSDASSWDDLVTREDLGSFLVSYCQSKKPVQAPPSQTLLPPIGSQEVWAAGVTYYRSRNARMEESKNSGHNDFYDRVYHARRPELFFKATPHRVVGAGAKVAIRNDASWSVPESELTLLVTPRGKITGYTIGNDMSSRDIEGENSLYLPQAKIYDRSCALGPCLLIAGEALPPATEIAIEIQRGGQAVFSGSTTLAEMKRKPEELVEYLYHSCSFPQGCLLLTGTGIVPPDAFTLQAGDEIRITIPPIGTLANVVG
jgi:2-dehydro-3-deoxy-D-arabinonate dehydratase